MDDDLDLLHGSDPGGSRRPPWALAGGIAAVALLTLVGVGWMVSSVVGRDPTVTAGAAPTSSAAATTAPATTPAPPTTPAAAASDTGFPTALPSTTAPPAPTSSPPRIPVPTAVTVAPAPRTSRPRPLPVPTPRSPEPGLVVVPDVVGSKVRAATRSLQAAGFKVAVLGGVLTPNEDSRRVTVQRPAGGTLARRGSTVIVVSDGL